MRRFILKILLFVLLVVVSILLSIYFINQLVFSKATIAVKQTTTSIILGHSHPECAYNDSLIDGFGNYAHSGESYMFTLAKAKLILKNNPQIKNVFIEFTNNQIKSDMNDWIWGDGFSSFYSKYAPFLELKDHWLILKNNPAGIANNLSTSWKKNFFALLNHDLDYSKDVGGYVFLIRDKTDSLLKARSKHPLTNPNKPEISELNMMYLKELVNYCHTNNRTVFLIRSPIHPQYEERAHEEMYQEIRSKHFSNETYLDFSNFKLQDHEFGDFQHLNHKGAKIYSGWFNEMIRNGLLNIENKQKYINMQIDSLYKNWVIKQK